MKTNIRGIKFEVPNKYGQVLKDILEGVSEKFVWNTGLITEIHTGDMGNQSVFTEHENIDGKTFTDQINNPKYYTIFCNLKGSYVENQKSVDDYEDFINSECEIVLFIVDCSYTDIYIKDANILKVLEENAKKNKYEKIEYITEKNDRFTKFEC